MILFLQHKHISFKGHEERSMVDEITISFTVVSRQLMPTCAHLEASKSRMKNHYLSDNLRNTGLIFAVVPTTIKVMIPPNATEGIRPISLAVTPDSKAPSSFDEPIKILFTEATRPRMCSGV